MTTQAQGKRLSPNGGPHCTVNPTDSRTTRWQVSWLTDTIASNRPSQGSRSNPQWSLWAEALCLQLREQLRNYRGRGAPNSLFTTGYPVEPSGPRVQGGIKKIKRAFPQRAFPVNTTLQTCKVLTACSQAWAHLCFGHVWCNTNNQKHGPGADVFNG